MASLCEYPLRYVYTLSVCARKLCFAPHVMIDVNFTPSVVPPRWSSGTWLTDLRHPMIEVRAALARRVYHGTHSDWSTLLHTHCSAQVHSAFYPQRDGRVEITFRADNNNNNNNNNRFTALCPGLPGWAGTRRNIHPPTTILIIIQSLSASSIYYES